MNISNPEKILKIRDAAEKMYRNVSLYTTPSSAPYLFSTENLMASFDVIKPAGRKVLTVAASGDQAFDAYLHGARHVDTFDFNLMQECVMRLKTDLIHHMNYNQFMNFFFESLIPGKIDDSYNILRPFIPHLSDEGRELMGQFYNCPDKRMFFMRAPFFGTTMYNYKRNKISYFQSETNFNTLKKRLPERINFTLADSETMAKNINGQYDIIHLSNIMTAYVDNFYEQTNGFMDYYNGTIRPMANHLAPDGVMVANYLWDGNFHDQMIYPYHTTFYKTIKSEPDLSHSIVDIESVRHGLDIDALLLIHKTR